MRSCSRRNMWNLKVHVAFLRYFTNCKSEAGIGLGVKVKCEDGEPCSSCTQLRRNLKEFQDKNSQLEKILRLREMELEVLKGSPDLVMIE